MTEIWEKPSSPILSELDKPGITNEEAEALYERWANDYEKEMVYFNYFGPSYTANEVQKVLADNKDALILDVACGTGLAGVELTKRGFHNLHALDGSPAMLEKAKQKGIYKKMICTLLGPDRLDIPDNTYDAVVMAGGVAVGQVEGSCFGEFIRIVKPGGYVVMDSVLKYLHDVGYGGKSWDELIDGFLVDGSWVTVTRRLVKQAFNSLDGMQYAFQVK